MLQYLLYRHLIGSVLLFIATVIVFVLAGEALSGASLNSGVSVGDVVFERLPNTLKLLPLTIFFAAVISIPLGILAAVCRGTLVDRAVGSLAVLGVATPNFWLGLVLIYLFYVLPDRLPSLGMEGPSSYILPCFVLGTFAGAGMTWVIRSGIVEVLHREEQPGWRVFWNPCFRLLAAAPILFRGFLAGAVVVETTFSWPGIGYLALRAMFQADMPVLLAIILLAAAIALSFKLAVDFLVMVVEVLVRGPNPAIPQDWRRTGPPFPRIAPARPAPGRCPGLA